MPISAMTTHKRLVLFVEGEGDADAVPLLVKRLMTDHNLWEGMLLDQNPFRVESLAVLIRQNGKKWLNWLKAAGKRKNLGGVLLLLDGDVKPRRSRPFCAAEAAQQLAELASRAGAGTMFSLACVFAVKEYESWLIACSDHLAGRRLPGGEEGIERGTVPPEGDLELAPRDAKKWLDERMPNGYKPRRHQAALTEQMVECLDSVRHRGLRSFRRLENALKQLTEAIRTGNHVLTPR
jgi:hypothetical protein